MMLGTGPGSGKTVVTAGTCRLLSNTGARVAPFKAVTVLPPGVRDPATPNGNNALAHLRRAARVEFHWAFNPVVVVPDGRQRGRLLIAGRPSGTVTLAGEDALWTGDLSAPTRQAIAEAVAEGHAWLTDRYETIVIEGAGSATDLPPDGDVANVAVARLCSPPVVLVAKLSRGGAAAGLAGTAACLPPDVRRLVSGFVLSDVTQPGLAAHTAGVVERTTGMPHLGSVPSLGPPRKRLSPRRDLEWQYEALARAIAEQVSLPGLVPGAAPERTSNDDRCAR